ncbi:hypothetical protein J2X65_005078 [Ancylobacter sp. 3268]|uniref:hypothetical protein n=1 Tax=Ancylobacter sp. 3268 TaxID=2817752 RepID=UPI00285C37CF|nr:hypothetical protein [Ancylobacter sp. 3268]MDR6955695.1 hypothetical protein [Ancylobacter sp. 3268]
MAKVNRGGDKWVVAPDNPPDAHADVVRLVDLQDTPGAEKKRGDTVKIGFRANYIEVPGGTIVAAGYNDLEKIVWALRRSLS